MDNNVRHNLYKLEVPCDDENTSNWRVICEHAEINSRILEYNKKHMSQASDTPFGHGKGFEVLHGHHRKNYNG